AIASTNAAWEKVAERLGEPLAPPTPNKTLDKAANIFEVVDLKRHFLMSGNFFTSLFSSDVSTVHAIDGISFELRNGEILGLVGESGSGKTTTAEMLIRLQTATEGEIRFQGKDIAELA